MTAERQPERGDEEEAEAAKREAGGGTDTRNGTDSQMLLNQLKEITGIQDATVLRDALKASNYDVTRAVGLLTGESAKEPDSRICAVEPTDNGRSALGVIDQHALQAAIALSLQERSGPLDGKEPDRFHEPQVRESKSRAKRKRCEAWGDRDLPNPSDFSRCGDWPVGLKNIGNTCWFSAVIQSLFHLPEFRRLVFSYSNSHPMLEKSQSQNEKRNIAFMQELQCLFALMVGSNRKFVDPSPALELLKHAFLSAEAQQQDISEFTHKLLDWLEDAFQQTVIGENQRDKSDNPMVQLFYGTFLNEGFLEDKTFTNVETFGQYPLQVNGFKNLNECLEGAMVEGEIEDINSGKSLIYRQERWFTRLPPVLTLELSRFEYNQSLGQPEKIHNKLEFPQIFYMDRYLYKNKPLMMKKREEALKLKASIESVHRKIEGYMKYGSGPNPCPLPELLQNVLEFASTKVGVNLQAAAATGSSQPKTEKLESANGEALQNGFVHGDVSSDDSPNHIMEPEITTSLPDTPSKESLVTSETPPDSATDSELRSVESCLHKWIAEVEQDIQDMRESVSNIEKSIEDLYKDPLLSQVPYRLHAVLVHEGQANAGHYWAYIYSHNKGCWLKYNDVSVTETTWQEVKRDSYGGMKNASAYCLLYINNRLPYLIADGESVSLEDKIGALSPRLRLYVREDNQRFENEVKEWQEAYSCKVAQVEAMCPDADEGSAPHEVSTLTSEESTRSLSSEHAVINNKEQTALAITKTAESYVREGAEVALEEPTKPDSEEASLPEPSLTGQKQEEQEASSQLSEVEIPTVGKILVRSDADGYNEEVMLCPAMQGVILAILKARQVFDRDGPEAGLVKAFREEYTRLCNLAKEESTLSNDPRLQHVLIYLFRNKAPERVIERTLLEQFADKNLSYDERSISIMKVARNKLKEIGPNDMDMKDFQKWHEDYGQFIKVCVYLLSGLELYQHEKYREALAYLVYAYQCNSTLQFIGPNRGVDHKLIELYRRKCLLELNDRAASFFESRQDEKVSEAIGIVNDLIVPCIHLMFNSRISEDDEAAIDEMRTLWCSFLGQDMDEPLQLKLSQFLPRLLDCSSEDFVLKEPPKIRPHSPYDLCSRFSAVMESILDASTVEVT